MKPLLAILVVFITYTSSLFAQAPTANVCNLPASACLNTPYNGTIDLANPTTPHTIIATPQRLSYAKTPLNSNFGDVKYVNDPGVTILISALNLQVIYVKMMVVA